MNREYGLGKYARQTARTSSTPDWLASALNARSDALNKQYGLGDYAPKCSRLLAPGGRSGRRKAARSR